MSQITIKTADCRAGLRPQLDGANTDRFAVIDTETTWGDAVMSIGVAVGDSATFELIDKRYYILTPFKNHGGMYESALYIDGITPDVEGSREDVLRELAEFLDAHGAGVMFAYNAAFDYRHLPELAHLGWFDIMRLAAYRQHNRKIDECADCYKTGRLKRGYGVESIYRLLSGDRRYRERHNALTDAVDELRIMQMLEHELNKYVPLNRVNRS
ncbi:hypothetical protein FACS1894208_06040 [Clostridia bacterium]|nr:hypothetical protein FACS1894208_06040 [Clostridia bacterium]